MVCFSTIEQSSEVLQKIYVTKMYSDIILVAGDDGKKIQAHKLVLAAALEYFELMFSGSFKEATDTEVEINDIDSDILEAVIKFLYLGLVEIPDMKTAIELLKVSHLMKITSLQEHTENYMLENVTPDNCLGMISLANKFELKELALESETFAVRNFSHVIEEDEFKNLCFEEMIYYTALLRNVTNVNDIAKAILKWINDDDIQRNLSFKELLQLVEINSITERELILKLHSTCIDSEDTKYMVECLLKQQSDDTNNILNKNPEILLVVKQVADDKPKILYFYNIIKDKFVGQREITETGRVVGVWEGKVVIIDSEGDNKMVKTCDLQKNLIKIIGTYTVENHKFTKIHKDIVCIFAPSKFFNVNLKTGTFETVSSDGFYFESCVCFNDQLYFLVYSGSDWSTIWLTTKHDYWKRYPSFKNSVDTLGRAIVHDQGIYFFDKSKIFVFSAEEDKWTEQLQYNFSNTPALTSIQNKLLVIDNKTIFEYLEGTLKPFKSNLDMLDWGSELNIFTCN